MQNFKTLLLSPYLSFLIISFFLIDFGLCANINITNCTQLDNITSSNNYFLLQDLDCPSLTNSITFTNGILGKKNILIEKIFHI